MVELWKSCEKFRDLVTKSAVAVSDKQDPTLVAELALSYQLFYEQGYDGMGLLLEMIYLLFCSFYDKTLTPKERVYYASASKAIIVLWREKLAALKCLTRHFLTKQSFDDMVCTIDGLIWYIIISMERFPDCQIVPWYLSSDSCEQLFAFLRTGRHAGRRTNLDSLSVLQGAGKQNKSLDLDGNGVHLLAHSVAHSRGRSLLQTKEKPTIFLGKDTTIEELKKAINEGHELGRKIFSQRTSFSSRMDTDDLDEDDLDIDEDSSDDDDDDDGSLEIEDSDTGDMRLEFSQGRRYHLATAVEKFCNEGRSSMAAQTRVRRIRIVDSSRLSLVGECKTPSDSCKVIKVGNQGHFTARGWGKSKRTLKMRGTRYSIHGYSFLR